MYQDFYQLKHAPFTATSDTDLANLGRRHYAVFEQIAEGLNKQQSLIVFMSESGLDKVAWLRSALAKKNGSKYKTILIEIHFHNTYFDDIVKAVYQGIGYEIKYQSSPDALNDLYDIFIEEREKDMHVVIIIDHAHLLPYEVLKNIPKLIDGYPYKQPLAQLILSGEPALDRQLRDPQLRQLKKRIQLVAKLDTFNRQESIAYIQRKLSMASSVETPKVLSNAAIHKIAKAANGIPRNLDMICTDVLVEGCWRRKRPIPARIVKQVLKDFQVPHLRRRSRFVWLGAVAMLLAILAAGVTFQDAFSSQAQMVAKWPQQVLDQVQPLFSDLTKKTEVLSRQAPKHVVPPMPVATPSAVPSVRPSPDDVTPPSLSRTTAALSPSKTVVETPSSSPSKTVVETPSSSPSKPSAETLSSPHDNAVLQQVVDLIDQHFPKGGAFGLKVWSDKAPGETYVEGENLILYVMAETPAFLWIDYYQADGKIVHLLPHPLINNQVQAGQRFTLGGNDNAFQFKVARPFGMEVLTVVASQQPIDISVDTAGDELNNAYVDHLSRRLQTYSAQGKAAAVYVRIQTQPQGSTRPKSTARQPVLSNGKS